MNTNIQVKTENKYNIKVIRDGEVREEYNFSNTLCKSVITPAYNFNLLLVGKGTGTPSWNDTGMFSQLWRVALSTISQATQPDGSYKATFQATIPADSSHVGTVTELGLVYGSNYSLATHALVTDAEGNPISINKTDLDTLIITIEFIVIVDIDDAQRQANGEKGIGSVICNVLESKNNLGSNLHVLEVLYGCSLDVVMDKYGSNSYDQNARTIKNVEKTKRLGTGDNNGHYFKAMGLAPDCIYDMKDIFTPYTVQGAAVGTGDGATTVFACPLSYFKENTEKIYKNGVQLTRGVDYTLDNINNSGGALFYPHSIKTVISGGDTVNVTEYYYSSGTLGPYFQSFMPGNSSSINKAKLPLGFGISKDNPLFIDYGEAVKINTMVLAEPVENNPKITLSYSADGAAYTPVPEVTAVSWTGSMTKTFSSITARYWRLENDSTSVVAQRSGNSYLIHKTDGITFTTAPATGDVITMDATLDYPMKNDKHVIDFNWDCTITLT